MHCCARESHGLKEKISIFCWPTVFVCRKIQIYNIYCYGLGPTFINLYPSFCGLLSQASPLTFGNQLHIPKLAASPSLAVAWRVRQAHHLNQGTQDRASPRKATKSYRPPIQNNGCFSLSFHRMDLSIGILISGDAERICIDAWNYQCQCIDHPPSYG